MAKDLPKEKEIVRSQMELPFKSLGLMCGCLFLRIGKCSLILLYTPMIFYKNTRSISNIKSSEGNQ